MRKKHKTMVAGHLCLDITPAFSGPGDRKLFDIIGPGKQVLTGPVDIATGGAVANTGLAMKILGEDVVLVGKIGKDEFGALIKGILDKYDCGQTLIEDHHVTSSYSLVVALPNIDRFFFHHPGANDHFCLAEIEDSLLQDISHCHFGYPTLMAEIYRDQGEGLKQFFKKLQKRGITTSLDTSMVDFFSEGGKADWEAFLSKVLPFVDFFLPSAEEFCWMIDKVRYQDWIKRAAGGDMMEVITEDDVSPLADKILQLGAKVALVKCGVLGLVAKTANQEKMAGLLSKYNLKEDWIKQNEFEPSYHVDHIVSGTGAGDTAIAAFLTGVLRGESLSSCLKLAAATGALCLSAPDALGGIVPYSEVQNKIQAGWKKNKPVS
ncbi:MAG: carbohydrate kinase family protein [Erysipelotrichaceae bacterium]|nr:carbohydrate kinase family protein [Erysipelotrichaceae bacterium]